MTSENWKKVIEAIGFLTLIVSMILVAYEVRQNTKIVEAQTRDAMTDKQMSFYDSIIDNPDNADIWITGLWSYSDLEERTPSRSRFEWIVRKQFRMWENEWYQYQQGLFSELEFEPRIALWAEVMNFSEGHRATWEILRSVHTADFAEQIDAILEN